MEKIEICDVLALVVKVGIDAFPALLMPGKAVSLFGPPPGLVERRQQHGGEDRDDCNYHKEFNQSKCF